MIQELKSYLKEKLNEDKWNQNKDTLNLCKESMSWYRMNKRWFEDDFEKYCIKNNINENFKEEENKYYFNRFSNGSIDIPDYSFYQKMLYERLGESLKVNDPIFIKLLELINGIERVEEVNHKGYSLNIYYDSNFNPENEEFKRLLNFGNYHITSKDKNSNSIQIEAVLPKEIKDYDLKYLYHVTNRYIYEKIKKYGLLPKDKTVDVNHQSRIYLWKDKTDKVTMRLFGRLSLRLYKRNKENNEKDNLKDISNKNLVLLRIDLDKFKKSRNWNENIKLYGDPLSSYNSALFTLEPIPSDCIEVVEDFKF